MTTATAAVAGSGSAFAAAKAIVTRNRDQTGALETIRGMLKDRRDSTDKRRVLNRLLNGEHVPPEALALVEGPERPPVVVEHDGRLRRLPRAAGDIVPIRRPDDDPKNPPTGK